MNTKATCYECRRYKPCEEALVSNEKGDDSMVVPICSECAHPRKDDEEGNKS